MSSNAIIETPNLAKPRWHYLPTCPPPPRTREDRIEFKSLDSTDNSCPRVPDLSSTPKKTPKRLMPRPCPVKIPDEYVSASTNYDANDAIMTSTKIIEDQGGNDNDSEGERKVKRSRRGSLLNDLPPRRASFAGAA